MGKTHFHNNGGKGRPYGLLLLVAFGFSILGVMVLHKLRERRIINLVVKEKDQQLFSLQLLLQKEREYVKEAKLKMESMKAKMRTLRNQKMELDSRLLEMQSTISSLRDDQMAIEIALEEKRNELNQLRGRSQNSNNEKDTFQAKVLTQILRQKEAEIEELKALSVRTDDSLVNQTSNGTLNVELPKSASGLITETEVDGDINKNKSADFKSESISVLAADGRSNEQVIGNGAISEKVESQSGGDEENEERASKKRPGSDDDDFHGPKVQYAGGKKLEMPKNIHGRGYTFRGKHGRISRLKGKRWRSTAKGKENNINSTMDTPTTNEGLKMTISEQGESEKGKGDTKVPDNNADDNRENSEDSFRHSMPEHAEEIMSKAGNAEEHQNVTYTSLENSNSSYEQSPRDIIRYHRDRGTYIKSGNQSEDQITKQGNGRIELDEEKKQDDPKTTDVNEAETGIDTKKQSEIESEEKGDYDQE